MKLLEQKGFRQFVIRTGLFAAILFGLQMSIFMFLSKTQFFIEHFAIANIFYLELLTGLNKQNLLNSAIFSAIAFILWKRKEIMEFSPYVQNKVQTVMFGLLALGSFAAHYMFKFWIHESTHVALRHLDLVIWAKLSFNIFFVIFLALAVYNVSFITNFIKRFWKDILAFLVIFVLYYQLIWWFQGSWLFFSNVVGTIMVSIFSLFFDDVVFKPGLETGPILGVNGFFVAISKVCSGIDTLLFFISLYAILLITNWNDVNKKRMLILFIPGVIGAYFLNIIRVFLLMLIAVTISEDFAVDTFHTNAGWILLLGYFILFWHFGSKWVMVKKQGTEKEEKKRKIKGRSK